MKKLYTLLIVTMITAATCFSQNYKVIVNSSNTTTSITKKELSLIFYKKKKKWADGQNITPIDLTSSAEVRALFTKEVHGKSVAAIRNYWQQAAFSGAGIAPVEKASEEQVIAYVQSHPGAIGYISATSKAPGVKTMVVQ